MKKVAESKKMIISGLLGMLVGIFLFFSFQQLNQAEAMNLVQNEKNHENQKESSFEDDFFRNDPFESMKSFRKKFFNNSHFFENFDDNFSGLGNSIDGLETNKNYSISQREDESEVIYEITLEDDVVGDSINVSVEKGMVTISGEKKIVKKDDQNQSYFSSSSSFAQSFSVPMGVDGENVKIENEERKILLRFPKLRETI